MIPVIALVGRPNVGKSTLFNRLTNSRDALVADYPGLTRDRKYGEARLENRRFIVIDTGGISGEEEGIDSAMAGQSLLAIQEADIVLFIVDSRVGLNPADELIARHLRVHNKKTYVVANKIDGMDPDIALAPFYELGMGEVHPTTATHGRGVRSLMEDVLAEYPEIPEEEQQGEATGIKIAIVGRPNVGKSTLVNRLLGEDRVVVYDQPGTTRDSIYINYTRFDKPYTLIDTAGVRRRKNIDLAVEKFSIVKTMQAIADANVVILVMDASEGIVEQDLHLMGTAIEAGRALVIALNKWDGLDESHKYYVKNELERRLRFVDFANIHFISALHGTGVGNLYKSIEQAYQSATDRFSTNYLTRILQDAVREHQPPMINGRRIKLRYAHPGGHNPPVIIVHGNQTDDVPGHYVKYLEKTYRRVLDLHGTPIRIEFRTTDNPYEARKKSMTRQQFIQKRRKEERDRNNPRR
ncbi:ribosome biogenesis GTPase Der [Cellvibrio japonicus]|uniref:GTPase Der n=1 Tax=Cellvibrio japonicus (strain Ueda107) TaxID=498211 RepID=DER_CELJU|nr:ribosome biogenesis GTPase Der [Cellvibrio japonicus]B3PDM5.1 RecName: Full=GTPase Der; AltName: Full=GTP-binding protein EngA [Cellvibrio japonicus Ueda107]ACE86158.1 GTP-binding protein EngA [Cellvibrio japonicus Ueda107]QEI12034.1 ribosome biogenesis GTPase Der [Cellvibrio japonicus]QEI15609.1 ribosome biogenesis GTPase Der [Cellvibrio japonicus]QEI19187.1 ribosome biogenesis GTPase Der [Cellvibrio japonicus]